MLLTLILCCEAGDWHEASLTTPLVPLSPAALFWPVHFDSHPKETNGGHCRSESMHTCVSLDIKVGVFG